MDLLAGVQPSEADPGLAALPDLVPRDESLTLGVITGQPRADLLALLPVVRPRVLTLNLIQFTDIPTASPAPLRGVVPIAVRSSEEFATAWNQPVRR